MPKHGGKSTIKTPVYHTEKADSGSKKTGAPIVTPVKTNK